MQACDLRSGVVDNKETFLKERISLVKKHVSCLCSALGGYARKTAAVRDKCDELAVALHEYAGSESVNASLQEALQSLSSTLCSLGDYRDAEVARLEAKVVAQLSQFEEVCKDVCEILKRVHFAREAELATRRYFLRLRETTSRFPEHIAQAEVEHSKAKVELTKAFKTLIKETEDFEKKKLNGLRTILLDFAKFELCFNSKAIELFTQAYQAIMKINVGKDVDQFRNAVHERKHTSALELLNITSCTSKATFFSKLFSIRNERLSDTSDGSAWLVEPEASTSQEKEKTTPTEPIRAEPSERQIALNLCGTNDRETSTSVLQTSSHGDHDMSLHGEHLKAIDSAVVASSNQSGAGEKKRVIFT